jgi:heme-degrading monooxygenase HmoA
MMGHGRGHGHAFFHDRAAVGRGTSMIARIWRGATSAEDTDAYAAYLRETGVKEYSATPGNQGVHMLRRIQGDRCEFLMLTFWDSMEAVKRFAGDDPERAVFYPADDRFLIERDLTSSHWEVVT